MTCSHPSKRIDGEYLDMNDEPIGTAFTCLVCGTSGMDRIPAREKADAILSEELLERLRKAAAI